MSTHNKRTQNLICGLDIGTTKVAFVIANATSAGIEVLGLGRAPSAGVRQGAIVNIEATAEAIRKAREEAELMSGVCAEKVWVSIGGSHIQSFDSNGMVAVRHNEVSKEDVSRVIDAAQAVSISSDRQVLHVLPKDYKLDGQEGITDPVGMNGVRLEASVHIVTGHKSVIQNVVKCVERAEVALEGLVLTSLASALAVLSSDEKQLGVTVVDIGGGASHVITFIRNSVMHTAFIPVGGNNFTHDVALGLRATQLNAEDIKRKHGFALPEMANADESLEVESVGGRSPRTVSRASLCRVLEARSEETLKLILKEIQDRALVGQLGSGLVLTGGGSELRGLVEMGDFILDLPVRMGLPQRTGGLTDVVNQASYATAVGLLLYAYELRKHEIVGRELRPGVSLRFGDWSRKAREFFSWS